MLKADVGLVVASCDAYSDLWEPLFDLFFRNWPDCPFPVYLVANEKAFDHPRVVTLQTGPDKDWSSTIRRAVEKLPHKHILFWIDDAFLISEIDTPKLLGLINQALAREGFTFLRLRPHPKPDRWLNSSMGELTDDAPYRVSLFATVWKTDALMSILCDGESAWQFELNGTKRSRGIGGFYCSRYHIIPYLHGISRGVWIRPAALKLKALGYNLDLSNRRIMRLGESLLFTLGGLKGIVFHAIPSRYRMDVLEAVQRCYRVLGLRKPPIS